MVIYSITILNATVQNTGNVEMLKTIITVSVPAIITIIGFIVTYFTLSRNFKNELAKQKSGLHLEKMSNAPYQVLDLIDRLKSGKGNTINEMTSLLNTIYAYGTADSIKIVSLMQKENYAANSDTSKLNAYRVLSFYGLLASQIKFDVTGLLVSPDLWFQMKLMDYSNARERIKIENNKLVNELRLNNGLEIK